MKKLDDNDGAAWPCSVTPFIFSNDVRSDHCFLCDGFISSL